MLRHLQVFFAFLCYCKLKAVTTITRAITDTSITHVLLTPGEIVMKLRVFRCVRVHDVQAAV